MRIALVLFTLTMAGITPAVCADAASDPLNAIFAKMDRAAASFQGMSADLTETAHTAVINEDQVESGAIRMKRNKPGDTRMLVNFLKPDAKTVQLQGHTIFIYLPNSQVLQEWNLGKNSVLIEQFLLLGFGTTQKDLMAANDIRYLGADTAGGHPAAHLQLTPKSPEVLSHVQKIELWLSPATGNPLQHKIFQPGGDYQLFVFDNLVINPSDLTDASLKIKIPKNVKVEKH
jgi:outer membrane lipoprotein-sorting protein